MITISVNRYDKDAGELTTLADGTRIWVGTKQAHERAIANATMPNNCLVCVTDDYVETVDNTENLKGIDGVSTLGELVWQIRQGIIVMGEILVRITADNVAPSTLVANGLIPAYSPQEYGQHWNVRAVVNGAITTIPVFVSNDGGLSLSGNAPTLNTGDSITFNVTYRGMI